MIEYHQNAQKTVADAVCPRCFKPLQWPSIIERRPDRYGRKLRTCLAWCFRCNTGFEIIQFERDGRWLLHKFRQYTISGWSGVKDIMDGRSRFERWELVQELPEPAPVVTGPGGDYDKQIEFQSDSFKLLKSLHSALKSTCELLKHLLDTAQMK